MQKICKYCNETFKANVRNAEYCSRSCKNKAYYDKRVTLNPHYAKTVYDKRKVAITLEKEVEEARKQKILQKSKQAIEAERLRSEELQNLAFKAEQERKDLEMYNLRLREQAEEERQRQLEKQRIEFKALREKKAKEKQERTKKSIETLAKALGSFFEK